MRATTLLLMAGLCVWLSACGGSKQGQGQTAPPFDKEMMIGSWQADEADQLIQSFEFAADKSLKMTMKNLPGTVAGTYSWSGNTTLAVEYQPSEETQKAAKKMLKELKEALKERGEKTGGPTGAGIAGSANNYPDELPAKEELRIGLSDRYGPVLIVISDKNVNYRFKKPK